MSNVLREAEVEIADVDEVVMVGGSTRIPILRTKVSDFFLGKVRRSSTLSEFVNTMLTVVPMTPGVMHVGERRRSCV